MASCITKLHTVPPQWPRKHRLLPAFSSFKMSQISSILAVAFQKHSKKRFLSKNSFSLCTLFLCLQVHCVTIMFLTSLLYKHNRSLIDSLCLAFFEEHDFLFADFLPNWDFTLMYIFRMEIFQLLS
jgi:hypothetical protein